MNDNISFTSENSDIFWLQSLQFWILLIFDIPSIVCSLFVLYYLLFDRSLRQALHNHTIIVLLILGLSIQLIDIPWYLNSIRRDTVWFERPALCFVWWFINIGSYNTISIILAWASIERHILVFHDRWFSTRKKRVFFHYFPLITLLLYAVIYHIIFVFFSPCQHTYDYTLLVCGVTPCYLFYPIFKIWEIGIHGWLCTMIIACFNIALLIRYFMRQRQFKEGVQWKKYRKLLVQLLSISIIYLLFDFPIRIIWLAGQYGLPIDVGINEQLMTFGLTYFGILLLPIVSLISLRSLKTRIKKLIYGDKQHQATVYPMTTNVRIRLQYQVHDTT